MLITNSRGTRIIDDSFKRISKHLNLLGELISKAAAAITEEFENKYYCKHKKTLKYFRNLFKEEADIIDDLLTNTDNWDLYYAIVESLFEKYLWEKVGNIFFEKLICFDKKIYDTVRYIHNFFEESKIYGSEDFDLFISQLDTTREEMTKIFLTKQEETEEETIKKIFKKLHFMKDNEINRKIIRDLVHKAALISSLIHDNNEDILMEKVKSGDEFLEDRLKAINIPKKGPYDEVLLGIVPVILIKYQTAVDEYEDDSEDEDSEDNEDNEDSDDSDDSEDSEYTEYSEEEEEEEEEEEDDEEEEDEWVVLRKGTAICQEVGNLKDCTIS